MPEAQKDSTGAVVICAALSALALLVYALQLLTLNELASSDAAGNAYAQAYAAIEIIVLWLLLAVIAIIAAVKGAMAWPAVIAAVILVPLSGIMTFEALELLSRPYVSPYRWPIVIPAAIPPIIVAYCFWALLPRLRAAIPAHFAGAIAWGAVLLLCAAIVPFGQMRNRADDIVVAAREKTDADYAKLPADARLWDLLPFMASFYGDKESELHKRVRVLPQRQADAELMLERGDFPLRYLGALDLDPTPTLCDKARALLRKQAAPLVLKSGETKPYSVIAQQVSDAVVAMNWLVGYECSCDAELAAWETMAKAYAGTNFDVIDLARLRDPKALGRIVRQYPERFSMLTPKAHLKAWLKFADEKQFHDQALAGARKLDHRTADAIEMLHDKYDISAPWHVQRYLPELDLETTPALCAAALTALHGEFEKTARPRADDPRPYDELLARLGAYAPLTALTWLAGHGCDAEPELSLAEDLIRAYQDSPARVAMLAKLAALRRK